MLASRETNWSETNSTSAKSAHALQKELGDSDDRSREIELLYKKLKKKKMAKNVRKEAKKQLSRMEMMHPDSSEATIIRTYIDWILDVPERRNQRQS